MKQVPSFRAALWCYDKFQYPHTISDEVTSAILVYQNNEMCDCHIGTTATSSPGLFSKAREKRPGDMVGTKDQSSWTSTLFLRRRTLLFQETNIAAGHVRENRVLILEK